MKQYLGYSTPTDQLIAKQKALLNELRALKLPLNGRLVEWHDPKSGRVYHRLRTCEDGRPQWIYVPRAMVAKVRTWVANGQRLAELTHRLTGITATLIRRSVPEHRAAAQRTRKAASTGSPPAAASRTRKATRKAGQTKPKPSTKA